MNASYRLNTVSYTHLIAYFGDSFIEADIFTADLREMLQQEFGGYDKISYLCIRFRKRWQNINESSLKDLR